MKIFRKTLAVNDGYRQKVLHFAVTYANIQKILFEIRLAGQPKLRKAFGG